LIGVICAICGFDTRHPRIEFVVTWTGKVEAGWSARYRWSPWPPAP